MITLADLVHQLQADTDLADPREIAAKLLSSLKGHMTETEALAEALPTYVRTVIRTGRHAVMEGHPSPGFARTPGVSGGKVASVRSWYQTFLRQPVDVSGNGGRWKQLGDCTKADLLHIAQHRRALAAANLSTAAVYEHLADELDDEQTVATLGESVVTAALGRAA